MKLVALAILILISLGIKAQVKMVNTTNADGSKSPGLSLEIGKPKTTITSESSFTYPEGMVAQPFVSLKGSNQKTYILLANESSANIPQFEIDIFIGNKSLSKATLLMQLHAISFTPKLLGNGKYTVTDKKPAERLKYEFTGSVRLGTEDVPISDGWFTVERIGKKMEINYDLTLINGVKAKGHHNLGYQTEDRSQQQSVK